MTSKTFMIKRRKQNAFQKKSRYNGDNHLNLLDEDEESKTNRINKMIKKPNFRPSSPRKYPVSQDIKTFSPHSQNQRVNLTFQDQFYIQDSELLAFLEEKQAFIMERIKKVTLDELLYGFNANYIREYTWTYCQLNLRQKALLDNSQNSSFQDLKIIKILRLIFESNPKMIVEAENILRKLRADFEGRVFKLREKIE